MNVSHKWNINGNDSIHIRNIPCPICHLVITKDAVLMIDKDGRALPAHKNCITSQDYIDTVIFSITPDWQYQEKQND